MNKHESVRAGVFTDLVRADRAVSSLVAAGFPKGTITVICPECDSAHFRDCLRREPGGTHTAAAAAGGGAIGALLGGLAVAAGVFATGGAAIFVVGPLLAGAGAGTFIGAMVSRGFEREVTNYYDQALQKGSILVAVHDEGPDRVARLAAAELILGSGSTEAVAMTEG